MFQLTHYGWESAGDSIVQREHCHEFVGADTKLVVDRAGELKYRCLPEFKHFFIVSISNFIEVAIICIQGLFTSELWLGRDIFLQLFTD